MSEVQRWGMDYEYEGLVTHPAGKYVTYADHVAALAEAEQRVRDEERSHFQEAVWTFDRGHTQGRAEALRQAREVVAGLPWKVAVSFGPIDCDESCEHGPCTCSGVMRPEAWMTGPADALAAIDALKGGTHE